jgi:hypothetical protein
MSRHDIRENGENSQFFRIHQSFMLSWLFYGLEKRPPPDLTNKGGDRVEGKAMSGAGENRWLYFSRKLERHAVT